MDQYIPARGDVVWIDFNPQKGREQAGRRPAVVLSETIYNQKTGLALFCPITAHIKNYPFETVLPESSSVQGAVLCDHIKNLDWRSRNVQFECKLSQDILDEITDKVAVLIGIK